MPILTKSAITKGTSATFTLDKDLLKALPSIDSDVYWKDTANWKIIVLSFESTIGGQREAVIFDATLDIPTGKFLISLKARDVFNIVKIHIYDFDGDRISIPRSALIFSEFDVDMTPASLEFFSQPLGVDTYTITANSVVKSSGADAYNSSIISTAKISASGYVQFTNNSIPNIQRFVAGLSKDPRQSSAASIDYAINNGTLGYEVYESGTMKIRTGSPTTGDQIKVSNESGTVKYYINGLLIYTSLVPASGEFYLEVSLYDVGTSLTNCSVVDVIPVVSSGIVWDITGPYTAQPNGGLTTTSTAIYSNQYAPSKTTTDDFDITFTFASAPTHDAAAGMMTEGGYFFGFVGLNNTAANIHYNNVSDQGIYAFATGVNIFRMTRVGFTITMYLNTVQVGSTSYFGSLRPVVTMHAADVLTSANIVISIATPTSLSYEPTPWKETSNYTVESDGGMTSTNTQYGSYNALVFSSIGRSGFKGEGLNGISGSGDFELIYNINCPSLNLGPNNSSEVFLGFSSSNESSGTTKYSGFYFPVLSCILIDNQGVNSIPVFSQPILLNNTVKINKTGSQLRIKWNEVTIYAGAPPVPERIIPCVRLTNTDVTITSSSVGRDEELQISQLDFSEAMANIHFYDNVSQIKGQSITPTRDFLLTGTEFYINQIDSIYHRVVLRDFATLAIIASTINYAPNFIGWVRADFDSVPLTAGVKYILEIDIEGWNGAQNAYYSGKSGNVYAGGAWMEGSLEIPTKDLAFKIYGRTSAHYAAPTILYTRDFVAQNSLQSYENFNTSYGGSYSFVAGGLAASTGTGGYIDLLNNNFAGASLPTATYKLRVYIASYTGSMSYMDLAIMDNNLMPSGGIARVSHAEVLTSVGGYIERTIVGLSQSTYLLNVEPYGGTATIVISKIELIAV